MLTDDRMTPADWCEIHRWLYPQAPVSVARESGDGELLSIDDEIECGPHGDGEWPHEIELGEAGA